jgi:hypothetical protein
LIELGGDAKEMIGGGGRDVERRRWIDINALLLWF